MNFWSYHDRNNKNTGGLLEKYEQRYFDYEDDATHDVIMEINSLIAIEREKVKQEESK